MASRYFSKRAIKGLNKVGDILIPANGEFPSFSEYAGIEHVDAMASYAPEEDIESLSVVMAIFSFLPTFVLRMIVALLATAQKRKGPLAPLLRQLNLGLRGLIFACYYAERPGTDYKGKDPVDVINFSIHRAED